MRRHPCAASCIYLIALASLILGTSVEAQTKRRFISIGTGGVTGVYFAAGNAICRMVEEEGYASHAAGQSLTLRCAFPSTNGSEENLIEIARGNLDFGLVQSDLQFLAYTGAEPDRISPFPELRSVFSLHSEPLHLVVAEGSGIEKFTDLNGKRVNLGVKGSGHRATMEFLMKRQGLSVADFSGTSELATLEVSRALCRGDIDAFVLAVGVPSSIVAIATDGCRARIVPLDTDVERTIIRDRSYYVSATIPALSYRTIEADVPTFGVISTLVTRESVEEEVVYEVTKAVMQNIETLRILHPAFSDVEPRRMIQEGLTAPLHRGARKYYLERGWMAEPRAGRTLERPSTNAASKRRVAEAETDRQKPAIKALDRGAVPLVLGPEYH